jgi:hypothetical protein
MATIKGKVSSEDEKRSTLALPDDAYNVALIFQEPDEVTMNLDAPQDTARWRLSAEMTISLDQGERITASCATIELPPVHHKNQLVAMWRWPLSVSAGRGRILTATFRWECDRPRTTANVTIFAVRGGASHVCGLFAVPFPGRTDVLAPFEALAGDKR